MHQTTLFRRLRFPSLVRHFLTAWLVAVLFEYLLLPEHLRNLSGLQGLGQMSLLRVLAVTAAMTLLLTALACFLKIRKAERWMILILFAILAILALQSSWSLPFLGICGLVLAALITYALLGWDHNPEPLVDPQPTQPIYLWITGILAFGVFLLISLWTAGRVGVIGTSTYDFGLFAQMFHNMNETGLPMTTLERDTLLSHFDVHVSPIYYLMLPFYSLAPNPATLQILQAAVMVSAVIPLWMLANRYGLSDVQKTLLCAVLLLYPAFGCGASYDLHENCFLTPLLLWLLYGIATNRISVIAISALLTLGVKEDAAVYVAVVALWLLIRTCLRWKKSGWRQLSTAILLLISAITWFFLTTTHLAQNGDGVMTYRYDNFMYNDSGSLITVILAVIMNPMKAIYECVDPEKLNYIAMTLLPLLGLPLLTRRWERYILLIPYVLINLMSDYQYQHSIWFQYNFGSLALLLYLTTVNLADLKDQGLRSIALTVAMMVCCGCFYQTIYPKAEYYGKTSIVNYEHYQSIRDTLALIPEDASVTASGYLTTHLSNREFLYDLHYTTSEHLLDSDYVAIQVRDASCVRKFESGEGGNGLENLQKLLERNGYVLFAELEGQLLIYQKTPNTQ